MSKVVIAGGSVVALSTAMLLAKDGHEVTVLERDPAPPPDPADAWDKWERRGVNQFRMLHMFMARYRAILEDELPELAAALDEAGALRWNPLAAIPDAFTGGFRESDEMFEMLTARRPVQEAATAAAAQAAPGVDVRRGVVVSGLLTGPSTIPGVPHVGGVRTEGGEEISADLVVDMTGRRSPLATWLTDIGAPPPVEEVEDSGFVYYGRHFQSADGSHPFLMGAPLQPYGSISILTLPGDRGTWGIGVIASAKDAPLRRLRDTEKWMHTVRSFPLVAHWVDAEPLGDEVAVMAKIEDRIRRLSVDGTPVATGVVAVADSWACTNPSLGRGASIGLMHALALRDVLRTEADDPAGLARAFDEATQQTVEPWYRGTVAFDRHRLAEIEATIRGEPYEPGDPTWELLQAMAFGAFADPEVLRGFVSLMTLMKTPREVLTSEFVERAMAAGGGWRDAPNTGIDREELLAVVND